jgi:calcium-dependent protein kinase
MLTKDPNRRPAAWELLSHPWLSPADTSDFPESSRLLNVSILTRLKEFRAGSKMRQAALHLITSQFTESQKFKEMRNVFNTLDKDHDGRLSREELMAGYKQLGLGSYEEVDKIMMQWDTSGNGYLAFSEFLTATMSWEHLETQTLEAAFSAFDKDRDGVISAKELQYLLEDVDDGMDQLVWDEMLREGDANKDGQVRNR